MKYTILSLGNPERQHRVDAIHQEMSGVEYVHVETVNGKNLDQLKYYEDLYGFKYNVSDWRPGELGLWYSNINAWFEISKMDEPVMVFEDDAIPKIGFKKIVEAVQPPDDFDFATYYTPFRNFAQAGRFQLVETGQEHGNICIMYSPDGASKILDLLDDNGIEWPVDIWLFKQNKFEKTLKGYGPRDISQVIIDHDFNVPTNIHNDERITR